MRFKADFTLRGAKPINMNIDGTLYDNTKIYLDLALQDGVGICTSEYTWGDHTNYDKVKDWALPADVVIELEMVTTGKRQKTIIHDVQLKKSMAKV